jgi:hypothetical protein
LLFILLAGRHVVDGQQPGWLVFPFDRFFMHFQPELLAGAIDIVHVPDRGIVGLQKCGRGIFRNIGGRPP